MSSRLEESGAFAAVVQTHWRELHVHCYRMLGSFDEAEDLVQETFLRAWRHRERFDGSRLVRAWLYRIATNACLDVLRKRPRSPIVESLADLPWLQPYPDRLLDEVAPREGEPEAAAVARENIELTFLALIQLLQPRQRAVLLARDVLGFSAAETAELLEMSVPAANSALQRARSTLRGRWPSPDTGPAVTEPTKEEQALLARYIHAHNNSDGAAIAELMRNDIRVTMPPHPMVFDGLASLRSMFERGLDVNGFGEWLLLPTAANRLPAAANYLRAPRDTVFRAYKVDVFRIHDGGIAEITSFGPAMFPQFGLPATQ